MKKEVMQYTLSIVLGTVIGGFLWKYIHWPVWLGATVGGIVGYLTCGWKEFIEGVKKAYSDTIHFKPNEKQKRNLVIFSIGFISLISLLLITSFHLWGKPGNYFFQDSFFEKYFCIGVITGAILTCAVLGVYYMGHEEDESKSYFRGMVIAMIVCNPFIVPFLLFFALVSACCICVYKIVKSITKDWTIICSSVKSFFVILIRTIHSRLRFAAGVWSVIGVTAGYLYGGDNQIVSGLIFGLVLGLLDYWIIAIRVLKLKPVL